jgi:hypothetical protein
VERKHPAPACERKHAVSAHGKLCED